MNETQYTVLKGEILRLLDIDIDCYKSKQMRRRLESFVKRKSQGDVEGFCQSLEEDESLLTDLRNMLTINVSEFFRDSLQFDHLRTDILPEIAQRGTRINIWSAGCSRGQEPYSLAMLLAEASIIDRSRIFATDLDREALERAKAGGPYSTNEMKGVPKHLLGKYFESSDNGYRVVEALRSKVAFKELNLLSDEFQTGFDLIVCRNVTIYFSDEVKTKLFRRFHASLKPRGVLFIGGSEALLGADSDQFERLSGNFYRRGGQSVSGERPNRVATGVGR
ncbi:MAG: chemotaxis protein CheR [Chloroflexi bacterium]|nr:chemotaxis protein CheR [Chloroflexota bacterium]